MTDRKMKFRLLAFFYDVDENVDIEYSEEIEIDTKHHVDFVERFCQHIADHGILRSLNNQYGDHSLHTDLKNKFFMIEEFAIYCEISKEDFDILWAKWKAVLKQTGLI